MEKMNRIIEVILEAVSNDSPDLSLPVTLNGVKHPNNMFTLVVILKGIIFFLCCSFTLYVNFLQIFANTCLKVNEKDF